MAKYSINDIYQTHIAFHKKNGTESLTALGGFTKRIKLFKLGELTMKEAIELPAAHHGYARLTTESRVNNNSLLQLCKHHLMDYHRTYTYLRKKAKKFSDLNEDEKDSLRYKST